MGFPRVLMSYSVADLPIAALFSIWGANSMLFPPKRICKIFSIRTILERGGIFNILLTYPLLGSWPPMVSWHSSLFSPSWPFVLQPFCVTGNFFYFFGLAHLDAANFPSVCVCVNFARIECTERYVLQNLAPIEWAMSRCCECERAGFRNLCIEYLPLLNPGCVKIIDLRLSPCGLTPRF